MLKTITHIFAEKLKLDQAKCEPELKIVELEHEKVEGVQYFPTCVRLHRCGGCCHSSHQVCHPTKEEYVKIEVCCILILICL